MRGDVKTKSRAADVHAGLSFRSMEQAYKDGMSLSAWLEEEDPSDEYDGDLRRLDAFERQLYVAGIRARGDASRGIQASRFEAFGENDATRVLGIEYLVRQWKKVKDAGDRAVMDAAQHVRVLYGSDDFGVGTSMRPYVQAAQERAPQLAPAIPVSDLVAFTTPIDGDTYRAIYLTDDATQERFVRVGQAAEFPGAVLTSGEHTVRVYKYGRKIKTTYEALRRTPIDVVGFHVARIAIQAEIDKVATIIDVMVNGDGNANTAATNFNLTTLDSGTTANNITAKAWFAFKLKFANPYRLTHILLQDTLALNLLLLNVGTANVLLANANGVLGTGGLSPINPELTDVVRYGITSDAPSGKILGFDSRFAIERVTEIGANITESQRWISNQTEELVMSEVEGYATFDASALKTMNTAA